MEKKPKQLYEFGPFRLDEAERLLLRAGEAVPLTPKAFDLLLALVQQPGRLLEKETLLQTVWPDSFVEEKNLADNISRLRKALGEGENGHKFIETVPKSGYRFLAQVQKLRPEAAPAEHLPAVATQTAVVPETLPVATNRRPLAGLLGRHKLLPLLVVLLFTSVGSWLYFRTANHAQIESLAVLPFVNEGGKAEVEYLSDGMAETLISSLAQITSLNVKPRSSVFRYKGQSVSPQTVGKELNVQALLHGTLAQRGTDLALHVELIDAATERVLWAADYKQPLSNLVALQSELGREVSNQLKIKLAGADEQKLAKRHTENAEAYRLYLRGRYHWLRWPAPDFEKSRDYYQQAVDLDPNFALAHAGLAEYYAFGSSVGLLPPSENAPKAEAAARRAVALDDTLPDAYNALAGLKQDRRDLAGAERDLRRAIALQPNYAEGYNHLSHILALSGRLEESLAEVKKALELEPLSARYNRALAWRFYNARDYDRAIQQFPNALELDSNQAFTYALLGNALEQKGRQQEAVAAWSKGLALMGDNELALLLEQTYTASGFEAAVRALWQRKLDRLNEKASHGAYVPAMHYALAYTRLGKRKEAFAWMDKAEQEPNTLIYDLKLDPVYERWRSDPRFTDMLRRIGLTQ